VAALAPGRTIAIEAAMGAGSGKRKDKHHGDHRHLQEVRQRVTGEIVTLSIQAKNVRIVPEPNRANDNAPSHRVFVGRAEIGAAWEKRSSERRDYLGLKLDDPSFTAPIYANLIQDDDGTDSYSLIWSRPSGRPSCA
jgi:uncharacterized protein (DUF736 family)